MFQPRSLSVSNPITESFMHVADQQAMSSCNGNMREVNSFQQHDLMFSNIMREVSILPAKDNTWGSQLQHSVVMMAATNSSTARKLTVHSHSVVRCRLAHRP